MLIFILYSRELWKMANGANKLGDGENDLVLLNIPLFSLFSLIFGDNYSFNGWL